MRRSIRHLVDGERSGSLIVNGVQARPVRSGPAAALPALRIDRRELASAQQEQVLAAAAAKLAKEDAESLDEWEAQHRAKIDQALGKLGFEG